MVRKYLTPVEFNQSYESYYAFMFTLEIWARYLAVIFKTFFHTSLYHCELVEMIKMQKWLICTGEEFTIVCVNPALMQRVILSVPVWSLREEEMLKLNLEYRNRNVSCKQKANQVNELFPNSLNQHLSSENPVLSYKKREKKSSPQFPKQLMNLRHFAAELCWLISFHLCHKAGARAVLESRSAPPQHFLSLHPIPCFCPLIL